MIKFLKVFAILIFGFSSICSAQHLIGLNTYYIQSKISCDSAGLNKKMFAEPGYGFGIAYKHMELRNIIGFQGEINYQSMTFRAEPSADEYFKQNLKYVHIPLFMHIDFGQHSVKALFAVGTYANILLEKSKPETNITDFDSTGIDRIAFGEYNKFTYGLTGQAGIAICTKLGVFQIMARGCIGMSKMIRMDDIALLNYVTERTLGLGVSYYKPFGKEPYYTKKEKIKNEEPLEDISVTPQEEVKEEVEEKIEDEKDKNAPTEEDLDWEKRFEEE